MKRIINGLSMALVTTFVAICVCTVFLHGTTSSDIVYNSLDYQIVQDGDDLHITQEIDLTLKKRGKPYRQIYQQYTLDPRNLTGITDISVKDLNSGREYHKGEPVSSRNINSYSSSEWNQEEAGSWYLSTVDSSTKASSNNSWVGELEPKTPDSTNPKTMLGARDPDTPRDHNSELDDLTLDTQTVELGWNIPTTTSAKNMRFRVEMTWKNVATTYKDMLGFQYEPIGSNNNVPIKKLTGTIKTPGRFNKDDESLKAWMHFEGNGKVSLDKNIISFSAENVPARTYVDLIVAEKTPVTASTRHVDEDGFDKLVNVEKQMESEWIWKTRMKSIAKIIIGLVIVGVTVFLIIKCVMITIEAKRGMTYNGSIEYWREAPDVSPSVAAMLYEKTSWSLNSANTTNEDAVAATMMSLVVKGYISVYPGPVSWYDGVDLSNVADESIARMVSNNMEVENERGFFVGAGKNNDTKSDSTIVLRDSVWNGDGPELYPTEKDLLDTLRETSGILGTKAFDFGMIRDEIRSGGTNAKPGTDAYKLIKLWRYGMKRSSDWRRSKVSEPLDKFGIGWFVLLLLVSCLVVILSGSFAVLVLYTIPVVFGSVFTMGYVKNFERLTPRGQEVTGEVQGLARYLLDFSNFKDRDVLDAVMWGEYMTYATALGIAPKVVEQLKQVQVVYDLDDEATRRARSRYGTGYRNVTVGSASLVYWSTRGTVGMGSWDLGSSISGAMTDVRSTISSVTRSSSGGSGGGSFGGSSGGSGGGSFGAR